MFTNRLTNFARSRTIKYYNPNILENGNTILIVFAFSLLSTCNVCKYDYDNMIIICQSER